jgi:branched-chain amino acid transport system ATP-binding protein
MTALLSAEAMRVGYGKVPVVSDLDLEVNEGEVVALVGPNGAGKSTTMLGLCGLLRPSAGLVRWRGSVMHAPLHKRAKLGLRYVSEERAIIRALSTADNLRLGRGTIGEALQIFPELKPALRRPAGLLSGGEQQMLALARALSGDPKLLMVDELSLGLAPLIVSRLLAEIKRAAARGVGILLIEQHINIALTVADRGYVLSRGSVVLAGDAESLRQRSADIESAYLSGGGASESPAPAPSASRP